MTSDGRPPTTKATAVVVRERGKTSPVIDDADTLAKLVGAAAHFDSLSNIAAFAGVSRNTLRSLIRRGNAEEPGYAEFLRRFQAAQANRRFKHRRAVEDAADVDWRAAAFLIKMEKDYPEQSLIQQALEGMTEDEAWDMLAEHPEIRARVLGSVSEPEE